MIKHISEYFHTINNTYGAHTANNSTFYTDGKRDVPSSADIYASFVELLKQRREMKQRLDLSKVILDNEARKFTSKTARLYLIIEVHKALYNTVDLSVGKCKYYTNNKELDVLPTDYDGDVLVLNSMLKLKPEFEYTSTRNSTGRKYYFGHPEQLQPHPRSLSI